MSFDFKGYYALKFLPLNNMSNIYLPIQINISCFQFSETFPLPKF